MAAEKFSSAAASIITQIAIGVGGTAAIYNMIDDRLEKLEARWERREQASRGEVKERIEEIRTELAKVREFAYRSRGIN